MISSRLKVAFMNGVNSEIDSTRGIGAHTNTLIEEFKKLDKDEIEIVDNPNNADITHYTKFHPFFISLPFFKPSKKVVLTIHDLIQLIYPDHYPPGLKGKIRFAVNKFLIWKNVDAIITISETSKKDICRFLNINPSKVHVTYLAPKEDYKKVTDKKVLSSIKSKYNLPDKFVFYFGDINYNKNIPTLVEACNLAKVQLVIVGKQSVDIDLGNGSRNLIGPMDYLRFFLGRQHPEVEHYKFLEDKFKELNVLRLGYLSDIESNIIYNLASVYVQPSFYEGFGLSVIHAFAASCPVVASKTQALVEIGEGACLFTDPNDANDMAQKISLVVNDKTLRNQLIETGNVLVKNFTWEKTAKQTLEVYKNV